MVNYISVIKEFYKLTEIKPKKYEFWNVVYSKGYKDYFAWVPNVENYIRKTMRIQNDFHRLHKTSIEEYFIKKKYLYFDYKIIPQGYDKDGHRINIYFCKWHIIIIQRAWRKYLESKKRI